MVPFVILVASSGTLPVPLSFVVAKCALYMKSGCICSRNIGPYWYFFFHSIVHGANLVGAGGLFIGWLTVPSFQEYKQCRNVKVEVSGWS